MDLNPFTAFQGTSRRVVHDLREHLLEYLREKRPEPGTRLATEAELVRALNISRSTLRRALNPLEEQGWIDRRAGSGTYVGNRVLELLPPANLESSITTGGAGDGRADLVRLAVLVYKIGDLAHDWYTPGILQGLDDASSTRHYVVELLGDRRDDPDGWTRRLSLTRPQVLICLSNKLKSAFVVRDAQRLGIHCLTCGTPLSGLELPGVSEDNRGGMRLALDHLAENGHERVALGLPRISEPWVFERLEVYLQHTRQRDIEPVVYWTGVDVTDDEADKLLRTLETHRATAFIPGHVSAMQLLDRLVRAGRVNVPKDLSVVGFEQDHVERQYLGHPDGSRIIFPLREMGQELAALTRRLIDGEALDRKPVVLPSRLQTGSTVTPPTGQL